MNPLQTHLVMRRLFVLPEDRFHTLIEQKLAAVGSVGTSVRKQKKVTFATTTAYQTTSAQIPIGVMQMEPGLVEVAVLLAAYRELRNQKVTYKQPATISQLMVILALQFASEGLQVHL